MEKSYAKLVKEEQSALVPDPDAVTTAIRRLRRHSPRNAICSWCENNDQNRFQVTDIDKTTGSVTEIKCEICKTRSYVCHAQCYCDRQGASRCIECSYKEQMRTHAIQQYSRSILMCNVLEATVTVLLIRGNGRVACSSCNMPISEPRQIYVTEVDRLGLITKIQCPNCHKELTNFSILEESYLVQMLYHRQSDQPAAIQHALNTDYVANIRELCKLLRRHSFYAESICPEYNNNNHCLLYTSPSPRDS